MSGTDDSQLHPGRPMEASWVGIASAAVFLSSAANDYANGHVLMVDGDWLSR